LLVLVTFGALVGFLLNQTSATLEGIEQRDARQNQLVGGEDNAPAPLPAALSEPFNVLLIGVDQRDDPTEGVRSDTIIVVHVNPAEKWAGMLSIPRDSVVTIPEFGQQKINMAYRNGYENAEELYGEGTRPAEGGGALAAETVEDFLGLKIDYIAQVDFQGFQRVVDVLGGVLVDVPQTLLDPEYPTEDFGFERLYVPAGLQVMDGSMALKYARSRHSTNDFERSRRQQQVLQAILAEVRSRNLLSQVALLPDMARELQQSVQTTLPLSDLNALRGLAAFAQELNPERIMRLSINPDDVKIVSQGPSDIFWDKNDIALLVARLQAGPDSNVELARIQVQNGAGVQGLATRVTLSLTSQGFLMTEAGDAPRLYPNTTIIDYTGRPETRQRLADLLGIEPRYIEIPSPNTPAPNATADIVIVLGQDYKERWAGGR
jgi:LCP family protein required for cell wall assembly